MTQPPDDAALVARLRAYRPTDEWGEGVHHVICTEAATALEAKDRRIAEQSAILRETAGYDPSSDPAGVRLGIIMRSARAALEPSDKGVGSA